MPEDDEEGGKSIQSSSREVFRPIDERRYRIDGQRESATIGYRFNNSGLLDMGAGYNFAQLQQEIFNRSSEKIDWTLCKNEWRVHDIYRVGEEQVCLCGHHPIFQICELKNDVTRQRADVGNVCVQKFIGLKSKRLFAALKRVELDPTRSLNKEALELYTHLRVIGAQDAEEYLSFYRKRKGVSEDQMKFKVAINKKIVAYAAKKAQMLQRPTAHWGNSR